MIKKSRERRGGRVAPVGNEIKAPPSADAQRGPSDATAHGGRLQQADLTRALIDIGVESWRLSKLIARVISKLEPTDGVRFASQLRFSLKRVEESLEGAGVRLVNVEGQTFDPGMAATALNLGDFGPDDLLFVDQMVEPIIMGPEGLLRTGTVTLKKAGV